MAVPPGAPTAEDAYDELSGAYRALEADPYCAHLAFPAMTDLLPDVAGARVLDAGCGAGRYAEWLLDRGAEVVAVDASAAMVERARRRTDGRATVHQADLSEPLEFAADDAFDAVVSGLALHYLADWRPTLREFARVLRPGGVLAFSTHHPVDDYVAFDGEDYFAVERETTTWSTPDGPVEVPFYSRPFAAVVDPLLAAGFRLEEVVEPTPTEAFAEAKPESYEKRTTHPTFLCVRATNAG